MSKADGFFGSALGVLVVKVRRRAKPGGPGCAASKRCKRDGILIKGAYYLQSSSKTEDCFEKVSSDTLEYNYQGKAIGF